MTALFYSDPISVVLTNEQFFVQQITCTEGLVRVYTDRSTEGQTDMLKSAQLGTLR